MSTMADILGVELPDTAGVDSFSILPILQGQSDREPAHPYIIHHSSKGCFAIRQDRWKLVACKGSGGYSKGDDGQPAQLYDLEADPYEQVNLIQTEPQQAASLADLLESAVANGRSTPGRWLVNDVPVDIWKTETGRPSVLNIFNAD
jgi:arylsulfatase A-like enzyme